MDDFQEMRKNFKNDKFSEHLQRVIFTIAIDYDLKYSLNLIQSCFVVLAMVILSFSFNVKVFYKNINLPKLFQYPWFFHDEGPYHIETSPLICKANQKTGFYMIKTSAMK